MNDKVTPFPGSSGPTMRDMRHAIEMMDCSAQQGLGQVDAIAGLVKKGVSTVLNSSSHDLPRAHALEISTAMDAIQYICQDLGNGINCEAEQVGCNYKCER